jgi:hypothetical protein
LIRRRAYGSCRTIRDLEPLKSLTALQTLNLAYADVGDLEPLKSLTALQTLNLKNSLEGLDLAANAQPVRVSNVRNRDQ